MVAVRRENGVRNSKGRLCLRLGSLREAKGPTQRLSAEPEIGNFLRLLAKEGILNSIPQRIMSIDKSVSHGTIICA